MLSEIERFDKWLRRKSPHTATRIHYVSDSNCFSTGSKKPPNAITVLDVDAFIEHSQQASHSIATVNDAWPRSVRSTFLDIESDPAPANPVLPKTSFHPARPTPAAHVQDPDLDKLFAVITLPRDRAMFLLMLRCVCVWVKSAISH